jgi:hypothetical protein
LPAEPGERAGNGRGEQTKFANVPITLALDAAVEIERLRTALQKIAYPEWGEYPSDEMIVKAVVRIARAALTKDKP